MWCKVYAVAFPIRYWKRFSIVRGLVDPESHVVTGGILGPFRFIFGGNSVEENATITRKAEVKQAELAAILGLTGRRVAQLCEDGVIAKSSRGRYLLADCVQKYIAYKLEDAEAGIDAEIEREKRRAEADLKKAKAARAKLEAAELEGNMHRSEDVEAAVTDLVYNIRGALIALPGRVAVDVAAVSTPAEASTIVRREVYAIMRELANYRYDPKKYEERVRARMDWSARGSDEDAY